MPRAALRRLRMAVALLAVLVASMAVPAAAQGTASGLAQAERLADEYARALAQVHVAPVFVARGQEVGAVFDPVTAERLYDPADCFDGLAPQVRPGELPEVIFGGGRDVALALGAPSLASVEAAAGGMLSATIAFDVERVEFTSREQLLRRLRPDACPEVERLLRNQAATDAPVPVLLSEVYFGRRLVRMQVRSGAGLDARLDGIRSLARRLGFEVNASATADSSRYASIEMRSANVVPVAYRPAFIPVRRLLGIRMGGSEPGAEGRTVVQRPEWFDSHLETHAQEFEVWLQTRSGAAR